MTDDELPLGERIARAIEGDEIRLNFPGCLEPAMAFRSFLAGMDFAARIARETSPWISADRHPPASDREVLTFSAITGRRFLATWDAANGVFRTDEGAMIPGTWWMALPDVRLSEGGDE